MTQHGKHEQGHPQQGPADPDTGYPRRWYVLAVLCVVLLIVVLDNTILNVALPRIQEDLDATQSQQEWMVDSYTLAFAGLLFTFGVLGDRLGRKRMLAIGLAVFGLGSIASAWASSAGVLIATRAVMGVGGAAVMPSTLSIISNVFNSRERGKAIGIWAGVSGMAIAIGPISGGALLENFWWGSVFLVNVPIVIVGLVAVAVIVPESKDPHPRNIDVPGVALSVVGLVALVYGIIKGGQHNQWTSASTLVPLIAGIVLLAGFVFLERRSDHPSLDVTLFKNPAFSAASVAISLVFFGLFGATFFLTYYLQFDRGYSPLEAGVRLLPVAVAILVFSPRSAKVARRFGNKATVAGGMALVMIAYLGYQLLYTHTTIWLLEGMLFVQGVGMANVMAPATESIMSTLPRERAGAGSAVNNTMRQVGGALGVAVLGSVLSSTYRGKVTPTIDAMNLPTSVRDAAEESIGALYQVIGNGKQPSGPQWQKGQDAFIHAMHVTSAGSALVVFIGLLVVLKWLPGKTSDARQGTTTEVTEPVHA
jgi:DHA2 family multidrug resistance protein-like MFS transporter